MTWYDMIWHDSYMFLANRMHFSIASRNLPNEHFLSFHWLSLIPKKSGRTTSAISRNRAQFPAYERRFEKWLFSNLAVPRAEIGKTSRLGFLEQKFARAETSVLLKLRVYIQLYIYIQECMCIYIYTIIYTVYIYIHTIMFLYTCINMYVYQVCFSMYRSYHICRRLWIWSEVAPGCQGITLQILSRLRQSYPNGPKELKSGILQQKYVFWHLRTLQSSFACFTASPGKYGEAAALLQGLQSSQLALAIGLALWNGLSCRRPHPTSWGHRACGLCPRLTVLRFPLIPTSSSALCSLFCRILTSIWKHMPWTELVLLRAMTSYDCFRFHCDCLIQLRMSMKQLYVVVHSCTYLYTIESILYSFLTNRSLASIMFGVLLRFGLQYLMRQGHTVQQIQRRDPDVYQKFTNFFRTDMNFQGVAWRSLCCDCAVSADASAVEGGKMGKDIRLRQVSPCFTSCRPCLYPGDGIHKASGLVKFEGNDKKNLLMVQQNQNGQNVEALTCWSTWSTPVEFRWRFTAESILYL